MSAMRTLVASAVVLFLLAAVVPNASAQTGLVATKLDTSSSETIFPKAEGDGLPQGDLANQAFVRAQFCWEGQGAMNPDSTKEWSLTVAIAAPEWAEVTTSDGPFSLVPPTGPTTGAECDERFEWALKGGPKADAPNGTTGDVQVTFSIEGPAEIGTYKKPVFTSDTVALKLKAADPGNDPLAELNNPGTTGGGGGGGDDPETQEGSAPVAPLTALLGLAVLAFARRRF
ncbi:MAG: hypothetical protein KY455_00150 [Euryarchaeota archaeon]|nr:hypothetical protein [Euryarchaeota archaeon]